jgi:hypothetical protein
MQIHMLHPVHPPHETYESTWGAWRVGGASVQVPDEIGNRMMADFPGIFTSDQPGADVSHGAGGVPLTDRAYRGGKRRA